MELKTRLDHDRYFWITPDLDQSDAAAALVEITAPSVDTEQKRGATHLVVALDRSGSMGGAEIEHARRALCDIVDQLGPADSFGLVSFDDRVELTVPAAPVADREVIKRAIRSVDARGMTDLGGGLLKALEEAKRLGVPEGVRVLLISDGHANQGITDAQVLAGYVSKQLDRRISTSSLGLGLGYDPLLLTAISRAGGGNEHFAEDADTAAGQIGQECGELLGQRFLSGRLTVQLGTGATQIDVLNELTTQLTPDGLQIDLGGFQSDETKSLVIQFVPRTATKPGRRKLATLTFDYLSTQDLSERTVRHTLWAQIASPYDSPAAPRRDVLAEVLWQEIQRRKRRGMRALSRGDVQRGRHHITRAIEKIKRSWNDIPLERRAEFEAEIELLGAMEQRVVVEGVAGSAFAARAMSSDVHMKSRRSGRRGA
ncbi:VWA domain-containing protein [Aeromicrobium sp. NPDC092404]|uniref:vWA domain-containing protein n=1 Tax=Aeromicrobium sp. NPDC092404 TaxID=3154976 RepID=UPI00343C627E